MDNANRFTALNRSIRLHLRNSNCSLRVCRRWLKRVNNHGRGFIFIDDSITSGGIAKRTAWVDSTCEIGPFIRSNSVLIVVWGLSSVNLNSPKLKLGHVFIDFSTTSGATYYYSFHKCSAFMGFIYVRRKRCAESVSNCKHFSKLLLTISPSILQSQPKYVRRTSHRWSRRQKSIFQFIWWRHGDQLDRKNEKFDRLSIKLSNFTINYLKSEISIQNFVTRTLQRCNTLNPSIPRAISS